MDNTMYPGYGVMMEYNSTVHINGTRVVVSAGYLQAATENHQQYIVGLILSSLYTIFLFPVGLIGNILILVVNLDHSGHLTAPDLYFVNLAVADLVLVADSVIEVLNLKQGYYDTAGLCTFMNLFQQVNMYSSVFFLTWMGFDRYVSLTGVMGRSMPRARLTCCLVWASSSSLTLLPFAIAQVQHAGESHFCFANVTQILWLEVMLGFLLPFCILALCYWRIAKVLLHSQRVQVGAQQRPCRQKALRMISAAVLVFFFCWLPENVFVSIHLLRANTGSNTLWQDYPLTGHAVRLAAFSNSCLNPLIYSFLGETFQVKMRVFLQQKGKRTKHRTFTGKSSYIPAANTCTHVICDGPSQFTRLSSNSLLRTVLPDSNTSST
ncbi:G-protein coupled estrogen receptor 1-like isoform X1 [Betta splendens]|uniref:G-protein coupled estrogen receptor 1 n=1 Tax=Betta splendens TaxID=158456 RepID=A0A6P7L9J3_BETSP|nr:G-protein coupled estrogen receptor 1-like isoform X1 [Betta splendens]XP_028989929.1 G-protein coupled estrogen receptor 1-like isoform X1 [Betta splendens]